MATTSESIVDALRELTEFVNDGREGYERAAKESKNPAYQSYYRSLVSQRATFADQLNELIRGYGGETERDTTLKGKLYRQWMDVKAAFTGRDEKAIIDSNVYGEEWAQKAYRDALETGILPPEARQVVEKQQQSSRDVYTALQQMKNTPNYVPQLSSSVTDGYTDTAKVAPGSDTYGKHGEFNI